LGTWALVGVAILAAIFARNAANAANETLRLEAEPVLTIRGMSGGPFSVNSWSFLSNGKTVTKTDAGGLISESAALVITNIGRSPAVNLKLDVRLESRDVPGKWTTFFLQVTQLAQNEEYVLDLLRLDGGVPFRVFVAGALRSSFSRLGKTEQVRFLINGPEFPISV
jgi:hypothetical protein